jgi:membrane protease YdiL (CAAX protease family)
MSEFVNSKWFIPIELSIATFFLLGANIFGFIPVSETPFILILAWISLRMRGLKWSSIGLTKQENWLKTALIAAAIALGIQLLSTFVTEPLMTRITGKPTDLSDFESITGNLPVFGIYLVLIWTLAAFGEEISYRGFFLNRMVELGNSTKTAWIIGIFAHAALFGLGHFYQGLTGIVDTGMTALILGTVYYYSQKNLWICILAHGFSNTLGLVIIYFDWLKYLR